MKRHIFPSVSPFPELVQHHERDPSRTILIDHNLKIEATAGQILHSVALFKEKVQELLKNNDVCELQQEHNDRYIFMLVPIGWEYIVSMLTILSLDAAIAPLSKASRSLVLCTTLIYKLGIVVLPEQAKRYIELAKPLAFLFSSSLAEKAGVIKGLCGTDDTTLGVTKSFLKIQTYHPHSLDHDTYGIDDSTGDLRQLGSLFFTSGTSGNPKGVVHSYQALRASAKERIATWRLGEKDIVLNQKPGNWMGGIFGILPALITGACL